MKTAASETVVIQAAWELPQFTAQLQVLTQVGRPRNGVDIDGSWSTNTCGGGERIARTDASGVARLNLNATFTALVLRNGGPWVAGDPKADKNTRELTDAEPRELFSKHKLTIR